MPKNEVYTRFMREVMGNFHFCSHTMPVPPARPISDNIRTLREEGKITSGRVEARPKRSTLVGKKENLDDCSTLEKRKINHRAK